MASKAQTDIREARAEQRNEQRAEQLEQAIIKTLQTGQLPSGKTPLQQSLENELNPIYNETFGSKSVVGGARRASRSEGGDIDGSAEDQGEPTSAESSASILTSTAFASGTSIAQGGGAPEIGQAFGSAERSFGEDGAGGSEGGLGTSASTATEMTLATESDRLSVYQYVEARTGFPLEHLGAVHTVRQLESMRIVRQLATAYPEFERLDGLPVSLRDRTQSAVDQIRTAALCHATIHAVVQAGRSDNLKQSLPEFGSVGRSLISPREVIVIDPSKAFGEGALAA